MVIGRQQCNFVSLQQSQNYQNLDQRVQNLISSLSQGSKIFEEVKDVILDEKEKIMEHISSISQEQEKRRAEERYRARLLESLWFTEILSREETIAEAHRETFEWVFDKSGKAILPWDNFNAWLENGEGIYWINGKAGSGKSTLMNFLCQDERTREALTMWSGTKDLFMPKFFFWSSGSKIQRSLEGLLRSLLWQILSEFSDLTLPLFDGGSRLEQTQRPSNRHNLIGAWTQSRLQRALKDVLRQLEASCCLCFFIDGLDEFDEDDDEMIEFVQNIASKSGAKVCSSSRPHTSFNDAFGHSATLRLQDLTYEDIQRFVTDRFQEVPQLKSMTRTHGTEMNELKKGIVDKADGVFLWVSLAVKDQIRGLRNGDGPEMLQKRLALLPPEIEGVYLRMLLQIDRPYRQEASHFLRMALYRPTLSLLEHTLVSYKGLEDMLLSANEVPKLEMISLCQVVQKRIMVACVGLLEVHQPRDLDVESEGTSEWNSETDFERLHSGPDDDMLASDIDSESVHNSNYAQEVEPPYSTSIQFGLTSDSKSKTTGAKSFNFELNAPVNFVHRTALEFLENSVPGKEFLQANTSPNFDPRVLYLKASLGELKMMGHVDDEDYVDEGGGRPMLRLDRIMCEAAVAEDSMGIAQTSLCELIDHTVSIIDRKHPDWRPDTHWCTRWGRLARLYDQEDEIPWRTLSSRSSSRESFYSAANEFNNPNSSTASPMESPSFLGLAASHGLAGYVHQMLDRGQKDINQEVLDNLLFCSVAINPSDRWWAWGIDFRCFNVIPELLRRGANPNAKFLGKSIWTHFLERLFWIRNEVSIYQLDRPSEYQTITRCTIAFIEHAVDMSSVWTFHFFEPMFAFDIELSALSMIQAAMSHEPDLPQIRETGIKRGAVYYSRCIILEVAVYDTPQDDVWLRRQYELSEQESRDFMDNFIQFISSGQDRDRSARDSHYDQIVELSHRFDKKRSEASENSRTKTGIAHSSWSTSNWSTFPVQFHPGTLGIKLGRIWRDEPIFQDASDGFDSSSKSSTC